MNAKFLLFTMTIILIGLFILSKKYQKKTKVLNSLEGDYFQAVLAAKKDQNLKEKAVEIGKKYAEALGFSEEETYAMLERDIGF